LHRAGGDIRSEVLEELEVKVAAARQGKLRLRPDIVGPDLRSVADQIVERDTPK